MHVKNFAWRGKWAYFKKIVKNRRFGVGTKSKGGSMRIIVKCAWCDKSMGSKNFKNDKNPNEMTTHSICPDCRIKILQDMNLKTSNHQRHEKLI
jgi:hypothetical protein